MPDEAVLGKPAEVGTVKNTLVFLWPLLVGFR